MLHDSQPLNPARAAALGLLAAVVAATCPARAAEPSVADCLSASDASLKAENEHKLRAERSALLTCAAPSCPADIRKECLRRADEVTAAIPTIVFQARDGAGRDLNAVRVKMDGAVLAEKLDGTAVAVDPGEHAFTFEAAGQPAVTRTLLVTEAQKNRREVVAFGAPDASPPAAGAAPSRGLGGQRIGGLVAGGVGVAGIAVGTAFGLMALSRKSDAQALCDTARCPTQEGVDRWSDARAAGTLSTIGFIAGGVALAAGVVLWATAGERGSAQIGVGPGLLQVKGRF